MPSWIRIRIRNLNADPDPATQINADPCGSGSETLCTCTARKNRDPKAIHQKYDGHLWKLGVKSSTFQEHVRCAGLQRDGEHPGHQVHGPARRHPDRGVPGEIPGGEPAPEAGGRDHCCALQAQGTLVKKVTHNSVRHPMYLRTL